MIALVAAVAFGVLDQGVQLAHSSFLDSVSGLSAPWLLLPFLAGAWQSSRARAMLVGLVATWLAVSAYVLMIVSPMEGTHPTVRQIAISAASQWLWYAGGLISGPLYGALGHECRIRRSRPLALVASLPVMLEPAARWLAEHWGLVLWREYPPADVAEVLTGLALTSFVIIAITRARAARR